MNTSMQKNPVVIRIPFRFNEFRKKRLFIDCKYTINQKVYDAHRIVLSKYSKLYFHFFTSNFTSTVPIPFGDDYFNFMVDFFYNGSIHLPLHNSDNLVSYMAMSVVYEAETLYAIMKQKIIDFLSSSSDPMEILNLTGQFKKLHLNPDQSKQFLDIEINFERLNEEQKFFIPFIIEQYDKITANGMSDLFQSVTPFLLSEILKKKQFSNEENAKIIDQFVNITTITEKEKEYFQSVIDWDNKLVYLLFLENKMEWVTPDISRRYIEQLIEARSFSSQSFLEMSQELCSENRSKNKVNNWWVIQQTQFVQSSKVEDPSDIEAFSYIGSIGNLNNAHYNPISFHLINTSCSKNLPDDEDFGIQEIFSDDPKSYYISYPSEEEPNPYVEFSFIKAVFDVNRIIVESVPKKVAPRTLRFIFDGASYESIKVNDNIADLKINRPVKVNKIMIKMSEPASLSFRIKSLKVYGKFNTEVLK